MFLNCRNLETPFVPKALILKHVCCARQVPGTTLGTRGDQSNAHRLGISLLSRGRTRGDRTARLRSVWLRSQNTDRRPAIVLGFGTSITQSMGTPEAFVLEEVGRSIQQIHGYIECFNFEPTWLGRKGRAAVSHIVSNHYEADEEVPWCNSQGLMMSQKSEFSCLSIRSHRIFS